MPGVQTCALDRKSTRLNSSHTIISYAVFCLKKKRKDHAGARDAWKASLHDRQKHGHSALCPSPVSPASPPALLGVHQRTVGRLFFNDTATTEIYTLSLHDALPI